MIDMRLILSVIPKKKSESFNMEPSKIHHNESNMMFILIFQFRKYVAGNMEQLSILND